MEKDLNSVLDSPEGKKLMNKRDEISRLAATDTGREAIDALRRGGAEAAVEHGDMEALRSAIEGMAKTEAGQKLMRELGGIMGK